MICFILLQTLAMLYHVEDMLLPQHELTDNGLILK